MISAASGGREAVALPIGKAAAGSSPSSTAVTTQHAVYQSADKGDAIARASAVAIARAVTVAVPVARTAVIDRSTAVAASVSGNMTAPVSDKMTATGVASHRMSPNAMTMGSS